VTVTSTSSQFLVAVAGACIWRVVEHRNLLPSRADEGGGGSSKSVSQTLSLDFGKQKKRLFFNLVLAGPNRPPVRLCLCCQPSN
jgi:hypothetical protein